MRLSEISNKDLVKSIKERLFVGRMLVSNGGDLNKEAVYITLMGKYGIKVSDNESFDLLNEDILRDVEECIGRPLGKPFYRNFPESVKKLSAEELVIDRLIHYSETYGNNDHENRHFSHFEEECEKIPFREKFDSYKTYKVVDEDLAMKCIYDITDRLLMARTLNLPDLKFVIDMIEEGSFRPAHIASKMVMSRILLYFYKEKDLNTAMSLLDGMNHLSINDVIRILGYDICKDSRSGKPDFKHLNLSSKDRKFYSALIEHIAIHCSDDDILTCLEKRNIWKGFLHHLHFSPKSSKSKLLVKSVFDDELKSVYSEVERLFNEENYLESAKVLANRKGSTALLRHLNRYLSVSSADIQKEILDLAMKDSNVIADMQFALSLSSADNTDKSHYFLYDYYGKTVFHKDDRKARPFISTRERLEVANMIKENISFKLPKTNKTFYIDKKAEKVALPVWSDGQSGMGIMNAGSRIDIPDGKVIRAFVYWEDEWDLDLSCILISRNEAPVEFSWRTFKDPSTGVVYSGDVTDGVHGGAEYFDIDADILKDRYPDHRYLIFSVNNFSCKYRSYNDFTSRAGFMMRDKISSGEIFEPKTVKSSYDLTSNGRMAVMYAIDLETKELVWINKALEGGRIAAATPMSIFFKYLDVVSLFNAKWFFESIAGSITDDKDKADVIVGFENAPDNETKEYINLYDGKAIVSKL